MKRQAAILGPTPSFLRWTISQDCNFRSITDNDLPYQTFRQLRSLKELSLAIAENRVVDGYCIHTEKNDATDSMLGFPVDEIYDYFGSPEKIENTCKPCRANCVGSAAIGSIGWAGCFGWLKSKSDGVDLVELFDEIQLPQSELDALPFANRVWYRISQVNVWTKERLIALKNLTSKVEQTKKCADENLIDFLAAVNACLEFELPLVTELVPNGFSDGLHWTIEPHCSICYCVRDDQSKRCPQCSSSLKPNRRVKRKVLGLRPYMNLKQIVGAELAERLVRRYQEINCDNG